MALANLQHENSKIASQRPVIDRQRNAHLYHKAEVGKGRMRAYPPHHTLLALRVRVFSSVLRSVLPLMGAGVLL